MQHCSWCLRNAARLASRTPALNTSEKRSRAATSNRCSVASSGRTTPISLRCWLSRAASKRATTVTA